MWFDTGGVGIGTSGPSRSLTVNGKFSAAPDTAVSGGENATWINVTGGDYYLQRLTSSREFKVYIQPLAFDRQQYAKLAPSQFDAKDKEERARRDGLKVYHFIAEEMHEVYPEATVYNSDDGKPSSIDHGAVLALNTRAIQDVMSRVDALEALSD